MTKHKIGAPILAILSLALGACGEDATCLAAEAEAHHAFLYGRVTGVDGETYEGRLRFGGDEEALWSHYFNGVRDGNAWAAQVPRGELAGRRDGVELFGVRLAGW